MEAQQSANEDETDTEMADLTAQNLTEHDSEHQTTTVINFSLYSFVKYCFDIQINRGVFFRGYQRHQHHQFTHARQHPLQRQSNRQK